MSKNPKVSFYGISKEKDLYKREVKPSTLDRAITGNTFQQVTISGTMRTSEDVEEWIKVLNNLKLCLTSRKR